MHTVYMLHKNDIKNIFCSVDDSRRGARHMTAWLPLQQSRRLQHLLPDIGCALNGPVVAEVSAVEVAPEESGDVVGLRLSHFLDDKQHQRVGEEVVILQRHLSHDGAGLRGSDGQQAAHECSNICRREVHDQALHKKQSGICGHMSVRDQRGAEVRRRRNTQLLF